MSKEFLKICFDQQAFVMQKYGGVSRYFTDLIINLQKYNDLKVILPFNYHNNAYLKERSIGISNRLINKIKVYYLNKFVDFQKIHDNCDIHHGTYYYGIPKKSNLCNTKIVSTLHDMTPEKKKEYFNGKNPHKNKMDWFNKSDLIISVSDSSKNDLLNLVPAFENKVKRVHLYSTFTKKSPDLKPSIPFFKNSDIQPYFLFVGGRGGYKNSDLLLNSFKKFKEINGIEKLIFAGSKPFSTSELKKIHDLGITRHIINLQVKDNELWFLYKNASALLVPSLAEGFSLPLVEGLVADIPIIASDISVHKEISSDFAYIIDPHSNDEWVDLMKLINKEKPSQRLKSNYKKFINYYQPKRLVKETLNLYKTIL